jgi:hypothetical protein
MKADTKHHGSDLAPLTERALRKAFRNGTLTEQMARLEIDRLNADYEMRDAVELIYKLNEGAVPYEAIKLIYKLDAQAVKEGDAMPRAEMLAVGRAFFSSRNRS